MAEEETERMGAFAGAGDKEGTMEFFGYGVYKGRGIPAKGEVRFMGMDYHDLVVGQIEECYRGLDKAMTLEQIQIRTSNRTYYCPQLNAGTIRDLTANGVILLGVTLADMDAGDTAYVFAALYNGVGNTAGIGGNATNLITYFSGYLAC